MLAVTIPEFGGVRNLRVLDVPKPTPGPGDVLVRVRAAGLNRADLMQRQGRYPPPAGADPTRLGLEFAGVIEAIGEHVGQLRVGQRVMGLVTGGAQAEYVVAHEREVVAVPDALSDIEAGAAVEVFTTAHDALFTIGALRPGQTALIHALGSGVSSAAVQLAAIGGARVIGTARTVQKLERAKELGVELAIDAGAGDFAEKIVSEIPAGVNVIIDYVGASYLERNLRVLAPRGTIVAVGSLGGWRGEVDLGPILSKRIRIEGTTMRGRPFEERCVALAAFGREVVPLLASGRAKVIVDRTFPLGDVGEAHAYMEANANFGKIVLTME